MSVRRDAVGVALRGIAKHPQTSEGIQTLDAWRNIGLESAQRVCKHRQGTVNGETCTPVIKWSLGSRWCPTGYFLPGVLIVAYDDDVPMSELICDGTTPSFDHSEAMVKAEMQALQVRSRLDEIAMHVDVRLTAIRSMLQRIASTPTTNYTPSPLDR
ncbi:hypothetical protein D3C72_1896670 [compost metagenome]